MRQKEKKRMQREAEEKAAAEDLRRRQNDPNTSDYVSVRNAECSKCGCEFDPKLFKVCPACRGRG